MKIKVTEKAWYKKALVEEGSVIDFDGDTVPVWGTLVDGEQISECEVKPITNKAQADCEQRANRLAEGQGCADPFNASNQGQLSDIQSGEQKDETQQNEKKQDNSEKNKENQNEDVQNGTAQEVNNQEYQSEEHAVKELEALKDLAVENDVWVEIDEEKMTIPEQIAKFKAALGV